jgi:lincosamide nucleotidyltransferase A/C/D/E
LREEQQTPGILQVVPSSTPQGASTTLADVLAVLDLAEGSGVRLWVDGGWGVDALLGGQSRDHGDLDVAVEVRNLDVLVAGLIADGFTRVGEVDATAWNFLLAHPRGHVVDLHAIVLDADGNGILGPAEAGNVYPAAALTGRGVLGGRVVECIAADWAVRFRDAYRGDAEDRSDVRALCDRFGLPIPEQYQ